ncbi:hypothetical protein APHAL10511_000333 [Amanita phalloides]|nr:hypothetical protein APHAL10511_000333 [Amanita phalloides]
MVATHLRITNLHCPRCGLKLWRTRQTPLDHSVPRTTARTRKGPPVLGCIRNCALVPPDSEIGRARRAVANITRAVINDLSSVPENSSVRQDHAEIFDLLGALRPLCGVYLENVRVGEDLEVQAWSDFWSRAEPILISLCEALDEKGLGLEQDERKAAGQEESR